MGKKNDFKKKFNKFSEIFLFAREVYYRAEYFYNPASEEERRYLHNAPEKEEILFLRHVFFRSLVIELSKIFSDNDTEKFNVFKLIRGLKPDGHFKSLKVDKLELNRYEKAFNKYKSTIKNIVILRNEYYAHDDDSSTDLSLLDVGFPTISILLGVLEHFIKFIFSVVYGADSDLQSPSFERDRYLILKQLADASKRRTAEIMKKYQLSVPEK